MTAIQYTFTTRHAAAEFRNLRTMVDGQRTSDVLFYGTQFAVIVYP